MAFSTCQGAIQKIFGRRYWGGTPGALAGSYGAARCHPGHYRMRHQGATYQGMVDANGAGMDHDKVAATHDAWNGVDSQRYWQIQ